MLTRDVEACMARIAELEPRIRAFAHVKQVPPLAGGALDHVPFGVKDIFDTRDLPTECGTPIYAGRRPSSDAGLVRRLRELGAVMLGKTHTTAFAYFDPAPTRNPRNLEHTPGGSSSGSAAAVAAGMVAFALGTQTQGSVLRPASFCGVVGFKPSHGLLNMTGVLPFAPTLDTAGFFTATVAGMIELWTALGHAEAGAAGAKRIGALPLPAEVEPAMRTAFERETARLGAVSVEPPALFARLFDIVKTINDYEGARTHRGILEKLKGTRLGELVENGLRISEDAYRGALNELDQARSAMAELYAEYPVLAWPAALGPAPRGLASTGSPRMNGPFTGLGVPAISIPMKVAADTLPLGLQLTAARGRELVLLATAAAVQSA